MKALRIGLAIAIAYFSLRLIAFGLNMQHQLFAKSPFIPYLILMWAGMIYAILQYRKQFPTAPWMDSFKEGGRVVLVASVLTALSIFIYYKFIDTEFLDMLSVDVYNHAKTQISGEDLEKYYEMTKFYNSPKVRSMFFLSGTTIGGLVSAVLVAYFAKLFLDRKQ